MCGGIEKWLGGMERERGPVTEGRRDIQRELDREGWFEMGARCGGVVLGLYVSTLVSLYIPAPADLGEGGFCKDLRKTSGTV